MESYNLIDMFKRIMINYEELIEKIANNDFDELFYYLDNIKQEFVEANGILLTNKGQFKFNIMDYNVFDDKLEQIIIKSKQRSKKSYNKIKDSNMKNEYTNTEKEEYVISHENIIEILKPVKDIHVNVIEKLEYNNNEERIEEYKEEENSYNTESKIEDLEEIIIKKKDERIRRQVFIYKLDKESILREIINEYIEDERCDDIYASQCIFEKHEEYWLYIRMNKRIDKSKMIYNDLIQEKIGNRNSLKEFVMNKGVRYKLEMIKKTAKKKKKKDGNNRCDN